MMDANTAATPRLASGRPAAAAFGAYAVVSVPLLMAFGSGVWFGRDDDWNLLTRDPTDLSQLLAHQHQHWSTLPTATYGAIYRTFGLDYAAFQVPVIIAYLGMATLVRMVMRRSGVGPWLATLFASALVLFGPGDINMTFAIQISMVASMLFGLGHLMLADHDGPVDRRDWIGLGLGAVGLTSSGVAPLLVVAVGIACILRRSAMVALLHTVPLGAVYGIWYLTQRSTMAPGFSPPPSEVGRWMAHGTTGVIASMGRPGFVGVLVVGMSAVGLLLAGRRVGRRELGRRAAVPIALFAVAPGIFAAASLQRWTLGIDAARSAHYLGLATALMLPLVAVGANAVVAVHRLVVVPLGAALVATMIANAGAFDSESNRVRDQYFAGQRQMVMALAYSPDLAKVDRSTHPNRSPEATGNLTVGFLIDAKADGLLPAPEPIPPAVRDTARLRLALRQDDASVSDRSCEAMTGTMSFVPKLGDHIVIDSEATATTVRRGTEAGPTAYDSRYGRVLTVQLPIDSLTLVTRPGSYRFSVCR